MRKLPPMKPLLAFEAAARNLSVTQAAQELLVTPSAISHQIRALEDSLGVQLFYRFHRRIALTDARARFVRSISSMLDEVEAAAELVWHCHMN